LEHLLMIMHLNSGMGWLVITTTKDGKYF